MVCICRDNLLYERERGTVLGTLQGQALPSERRRDLKRKPGQRCGSRVAHGESCANSDLGLCWHKMYVEIVSGEDKHGSLNVRDFNRGLRRRRLGSFLRRRGRVFVFVKKNCAMLRRIIGSWRR